MRRAAIPRLGCRTAFRLGSGHTVPRHTRTNTIRSAKYSIQSVGHGGIRPAQLRSIFGVASATARGGPRLRENWWEDMPVNTGD
jgi:hypothetical protein